MGALRVRHGRSTRLRLVASSSVRALDLFAPVEDAVEATIEGEGCPTAQPTYAIFLPIVVSVAPVTPVTLAAAILPQPV